MSSILFTPHRIGALEIPNRFVASALYEGLAAPDGKASPKLLGRYGKLGRGEIGLIIPGHMFVHPLGRAQKFQTGISSDDMIPGLAELAAAARQGGGRVIFQLAHAGRQTTRDLIGARPAGPSSRPRDPAYLTTPREMSESDLKTVIDAFAAAARRAEAAGADGVQLHAAHGYLLHQFLSPLLNRRRDAWGRDDQGRFRLLEEIIQKVRRALPARMAVLVKLSAEDFTNPPGMTPELSAKYAAWMVQLGVDALEVSGGAGNFSPFNVCRGDVPVKEMALGLPWWQRPLGRLMLGRMAGKFDLAEAYNLAAARAIKPVLGSVPLILVGGMRRLSAMEEVVSAGVADFISLGRPLLRDPFVVKKFKQGEADESSCLSCNRCLAAIVNHLPVHCYRNGLPPKGPRKGAA
ncbi:MAG: NADH:flavin oxidoreductase [Pseudomonadota bacterium]